MKLDPEWRRIVLRAWSVRLWALSAMLMILERVCDVLLSLADGFSPWIRLTLAGLSGLTAVGGIVARIIPQKNLRPSEKQYEDEY